MNNMGDYLKKRAIELGMDRENQLANIQAYLDELYPGQCRAKSLKDGVLTINTSSSSVSSELLYKKEAIRGKFMIKKIVTRNYIN